MSYVYFFAIWSPLVLLSVFLNNKSDKIISITLVFSYLFFFGMSYRLGVDWIAYEPSYYGSLEGGPAFESGYKALEYIGDFLNLNFYIFIFLLKLFFWICLLKLVFYFSLKPTLVVFFTIFMSAIFLHEAIRQQVAAGFLFLAFLYLTKNPIRFFLLIFISSLFHMSALLVLPIYILYRYRFFEYLLIFLAIIFFIAEFFNITLLNLIIDSLTAIIHSPFLDKLALYAGNVRPAMTAGHVLRFMFFVYIVFLYIPKVRLDKNSRLIYVGFLLFIAYEMIFYDIFTLWTRAQAYLVVIQFIFIFSLFKTRLSSLLAVLFVFVYSIKSFSGLFLEQSKYLLDNYSNYYHVFHCTLSDCDDIDRIRYIQVREFWDAKSQRNN